MPINFVYEQRNVPAPSEENVSLLFWVFQQSVQTTSTDNKAYDLDQGSESKTARENICHISHRGWWGTEVQPRQNVLVLWIWIWKVEVPHRWPESPWSPEAA